MGFDTYLITTTTHVIQISPPINKQKTFLAILVVIVFFDLTIVLYDFTIIVVIHFLVYYNWFFNYIRGFYKGQNVQDNFFKLK